MHKGKELELQIVTALNDHYYNELNPNLKKFISFVFGNFDYNEKIYCEKLSNYQKADILIRINNQIKYVSIKTGSQNSIHVEKLETFIKFLLKAGIDQKDINNLLIYHYGDDTLDGSGKVRFCADEAKLKYKNQISLFNKCINFSSTLPKILNRFLVIGVREDNKVVDAFYYGNLEIGTWCTKDELLNYCMNHKSMYMKTPHFSFLTYQNWCRNTTFSKKSEAHRKYIQIKWFSILSDISKIRNTNRKQQIQTIRPNK